jgi:hypothetical protein
MEHVADDVAHRPVLLPRLAQFNEVGILGEAAGIEKQRTFAKLTGCPPPLLLVTVIITSGTRSGPTSRRSDSSSAGSMFPLNGCRDRGCLPSSITRSTAFAPECSTLARVVSKWLLLGTTLPGPPTSSKSIRSLARPWWALH